MISRDEEKGAEPMGAEAPPSQLLDDPHGLGDLTLLERSAWAMTWAGVTSLQARVEADVHRECGLTPFELHLLYILSSNGEEPNGVEMPMSLVAQQLDSSLSRLSHVVRRLEARGWLHRRSSPEDARVTLVSLEEAGLAKVKQSVGPYARIIRHVLLDRFDGGELRTIVRLWTQALSELSATHWLLEALPRDEEAEGADGA